ncbi:MAG TPA: DUF2231 domain-containing protein [Myxococcota bacterium]|nr:DUF2231 domain-containing protein [Myxococcota bacterium]
MLPDPLHPAVVHLPIALAVLAPLVAVIVALAIRARAVGARGWALVVLFQALLVGSAWLALETGEHEEERVEKVVAERYLEEHEDAGKRLLAIAAVALAVSLAGVAAGSVGAAARVATVVIGAAALAGAVAVGHSGGELVYRHGAASAYAAPTEGRPAARP